jgi:hypothetical protein
MVAISGLYFRISSTMTSADQYQVLIVLGSYHPDVVYVYNAIITLEGLLDHRLAATGYIQELFGTLWCGHWPKAGSDASGHDY